MRHLLTGSHFPHSPLQSAPFHRLKLRLSLLKKQKNGIRFGQSKIQLNRQQGNGAAQKDAPRRSRRKNLRQPGNVKPLFLVNSRIKQAVRHSSHQWLHELGHVRRVRRRNDPHSAKIGIRCPKLKWTELYLVK